MKESRDWTGDHPGKVFRPALTYEQLILALTAVNGEAWSSRRYTQNEERALKFDAIAVILNAAQPEDA